MSGLLGADTRRVDVIAETLRGSSQDVQQLRVLAQRAVAEMRNAWGGPDFEGIAQRWEQEAGPRLADVSSALDAMASALRAQADEQRQASGNMGGSRVPVSPVRTPGGNKAETFTDTDAEVGPRTVSERQFNGGEKEIRHGKLGPLETLTIGTTTGSQTDTSSSTFINGHLVGGQESMQINLGARVTEPALSDHAHVNLAEGGVLVDASLLTTGSMGDDGGWELSAGKAQAEAGYSVDVDAHGNVVASAGVSAAAYAGYAAGKGTLGSESVNVKAEGKAYVGAEVEAQASGSIGPDGARGHLGAEAFAGGKVEAELSGTVAGVTATGGAEISYGIGAHAEVDAELSMTEVGFSADIGATLGLGAGLKADVSVNPQEVIANVGHAADEVGEGLAFAGDQVAGFLDW